MVIERTPEEITRIAAEINKDLDFPIATEAYEQDFIEWVLRGTLPLLPDEVVNFIIDASNGLSVEEIDKWEAQITKQALVALKIQYIPMFILEPLVRPVVRRLLSYCAAGKELSLTTA